MLRPDSLSIFSPPAYLSNYPSTKKDAAHIPLSPRSPFANIRSSRWDLNDEASPLSPLSSSLISLLNFNTTPPPSSPPSSDSTPTLSSPLHTIVLSTHTSSSPIRPPSNESSPTLSPPHTPGIKIIQTDKKEEENKSDNHESSLESPTFDSPPYTPLIPAPQEASNCNHDELMYDYSPEPLLSSPPRTPGVVLMRGRERESERSSESEDLATPPLPSPPITITFLSPRHLSSFEIQEEQEEMPEMEDLDETPVSVVVRNNGGHWDTSNLDMESPFKPFPKAQYL